jgi:hypothetical protein
MNDSRVMTIDEKKKRISDLRHGKKNFEQSVMLCILADVFVVYNIVQALHEANSPWYFYLFMAFITAAIAAIGVYNYHKSKKAGKETDRLINEIKKENPDEKIPEDTDRRRFF